MTNQTTTDFGYKEIPFTEKAKLVKQVFDSVAKRYDIMNDLMSFGLHRVWKKYAIKECAPRFGQKILDLAAGTGDLSMYFAKAVSNQGLVVVTDINAAMLAIAKKKLLDYGFASQVQYLQADAENLPLIDDYFDSIAISFGLRNVTDKIAALKQMYRVLKPGGKLVILEFSKPINSHLNFLYSAYSFKILPKLGAIVANDASSYQYLVESISMHPNQQKLLAMLEATGFINCSYQNLFGGICAIHKGFKI